MSWLQPRNEKSHDAWLPIDSPRQRSLASPALLFAGSTTLTIVWCASMSAMGMPMPGGWTMSMAWMRMPGQTWPSAAASFLGMWVVMMVAMMLPSLVPMLRRYRQAVGRRGATRLGLADGDRGRRLLLRLDRVRNGRLSAWRHAGGDRDAAAGAGARCTDRGRCGRADRRARSSSPRGRRVTLPAAARHPGAAVRCRPTPARPGDTACASASTAVGAVPV